MDLERVRTREDRNDVDARQIDEPASDVAAGDVIPLSVAARMGAAIDERLERVRAVLRTSRGRVATALGAFAAVVVAVWFAWPSEPTPTSTPVTISAPSAPTTASGIVVHVAGAVRQPGLYRLAKGSRVADLLEAAGGPADDLDLDRTNLAEALSDGARVWLPRRSQSSPAVSGGVEVPAGRVAPVDINTASAAQLDTVTGIGPSLAAAIVKERDAHGPFRTVDDLRRVKGVGASKLESIRGSLTAG